MDIHHVKKSSREEIRARFDSDVERFSNLDTGQQTTLDALLSLELITDAAKASSPSAKNLLDIGCGAGNYTLKMLSKTPCLNCTLIDLSMPMLERAKERLEKENYAAVETIQADILQLSLPTAYYDIVLAGAVLHHLREDADWELVFEKMYNSLKPGGSLWIADLVVQETEAINGIIWEQYGAYLEKLGGTSYKEHVFDYIRREDSPRSLTYQLELMKKTGFKKVEVLHKNLCFAAFGGIK